jgi:signal transduction histidine kinase
MLAQRTPWSWVIANIVVAALYFVLGAIVSAFFAAYGLFPAPIWLPAAIAVVAAMLGQVKLFPGIFAGSFLTNAILFAPPLYITTIISVTNALGPVLAAIVLRRLQPPKAVFTSFVGVLRFLFCMMMLSPTISATGGAIAMAIGRPLDWERLYSIWVSWWLCDSGGTLFLAPALLLWLGIEPAVETRSHDQPLDRPRLAVWSVVWAAIATFSLVLFLTPPFHGNHIRQIFPFLLVVPLSWVALRMSLRSAYTLVSLVAIAAAAGTVAGVGPFQDLAIANPLQMVGTLVVVLAMNVLTTVALVSELDEAQTQNRVKSMFLATTSHELRNPLNAILGFSSMIDDQASGVVANEKYADYARSIHTAGEHLLALINGLLDLTKIEAGRFSLSETSVILAAAVEEAVGLIRVQVRAKSVKLTSDVPSDLALHADAQSLRQILLNLLSNATKFTPSGGQVKIAVVRSAAGDVVVRISDTGVGIPAEALDRIFVPFERVRHRMAPNAEGTGLGLSITQGLIELHGGTIRLESEVGSGTTAIVTLPASRVIGVDARMRRVAEAAD